MKRKNGFTLIELMVSLAIIGILSIIVIPIIINIREDIVEDTYNNKKNDIFTAAKEWAYDNLSMLKTDGTCTYIRVDELIKKAYLVGDSEENAVLIDPRTGNSMNGLEVCITVSYDTVTGSNGNTSKVIVYNARFRDEG